MTAGTKDVQWDMAVAHDRGPGTYHPIDVGLTVGDRGYVAETTSQIKVDVARDFATTITITGMQDSDTCQGRVSGTISWSCVDRHDRASGS